jgi:CRP/FNR family cyclic AMP-dependent transcriptional regulator
MEIESLAPSLAEHPVLLGLPPDYIQVITGCASNARFNPGEFLFRAGAPADAFFVVRRGHVSIETFEPKRGPVTIETVSDGELIGWSWLIPPYTWHFDARALSLTRAIALDAKCLRNKCEADPALGYALLKRFSQIMEQRLEATRLQLLDMYAHG